MPPELDKLDRQDPRPAPAFIDHLLEWSRGLPSTSSPCPRPDLIERRQGWGAGKRNFMSLYLEPLRSKTCATCSPASCRACPSGRDRDRGRADGIPLYAVETVRMLVSEGRLVEGAYVPRGDLTTLAVPETLRP